MAIRATLLDLSDAALAAEVGQALQRSWEAIATPPSTPSDLTPPCELIPATYSATCSSTHPVGASPVSSTVTRRDGSTNTEDNQESGGWFCSRRRWT
jgi:hypothetical protein